MFSWANCLQTKLAAQLVAHPLPLIALLLYWWRSQYWCCATLHVGYKYDCSVACMYCTHAWCHTNIGTYILPYKHACTTLHAHACKKHAWSYIHITYMHAVTCTYMHILGHTCTWIFEILLSHTHTHINIYIYIYWLNTLKHVKICIWYLPAILSISCITQGCLFGGRSAAWWTDRHATQCHRVQFHGERVRSLKQNWVSAGGCNSWQRCWWWWCWWWWWWWWWWGWGY